jgi:uncharacterized membrane protein
MKTVGLVTRTFLDVDTGRELAAVYVPTTPNPTSGFLLFVPRRDIRLLDMTLEEAAKMIISAGLVEPEYARPPTQPPNGIPPQKRRSPAAPT